MLLAVVLAAGCRTPADYRREADQAGHEIIREFQQTALGRTNEFVVERPSDALRTRLMAGQSLPGAAGAVATNSATLPDPLMLTLGDCLRVGARNSRSYQNRKETVFLEALSLDLSRDAFRNTYSGMLSALFSEERGGDETDRSVAGELSATVARTLRGGATLTGKLALDITRLLTGSRTSTYGLLADATVTMPLLRGAGAEIVQESVTQAERNVIYAIWSFERYKRTFAVDVFRSYFTVLGQAEKVSNVEDNYNRLVGARTRAARLAEAGRLPETQVDQARQDELTARNRLVTARQSYEAGLDSIKLELGLPADARILLDASELERQAEAVARDLLANRGPGPESVRTISVKEAIRTAIERRLDLRVARGELEDAARGVRIAKDNLRSGLTLIASATTREQNTSGSADGTAADIHFDEGNYSGGLDLDFPWERTAERNAYREALITRETTIRALENTEDEIKQEIRGDIRAFIEARESYKIQQEALKLAERRINSTQLFLDAGRAEIRDILEAQEALISARNSLVTAQVAYRVAGLDLYTDMGLLEINEEGSWGEYETIRIK